MTVRPQTDDRGIGAAIVPIIFGVVGILLILPSWFGLSSFPYPLLGWVIYYKMFPVLAIIGGLVATIVSFFLKNDSKRSKLKLFRIGLIGVILGFAGLLATPVFAAS